MRVAGSQQTGSGFTLLEVLLATFILAVVLSAAYGAYITTIASVDRAESQADINNKARTALERIAADVGGMYLGEGGFVNGQRHVIGENRADALAFTSTAHLAFTKKEPPTGFGGIRYSVQQDSDLKLLQLYRADIPFRPGDLEKELEQEKGYLLCDGLRAVQFTFSDQAGNQLDDWQINAETEKAADKNRPVMMEILLRFANEEKEDRIFKTAVALPAGKKQGSR